MEKRQVQYQYDENHLVNSSKNFYNKENLRTEEMVLNIGPHHPATHGVLRVEVLTDGEYVVDVTPHLGYLHRCFEKHAENLNFQQIIPYIDRMDYVASMNSEHIYAMGVEKMLGITDKIPKRVEYIRVLCAELNRIASHFIAVSTYVLDTGATTPFLWMMRDREHILRLFEWVSGARMLYNYIWVGGLYYDLPVGFEEKCLEFITYLKPKLEEFRTMVINNKIFVERTANVGVLPLSTALDYATSGPVLRGSGLAHDLRRVDGYSVYPELDFDIPVGKGIMGSVGDCWDRTYVRVEECFESIKIVEQCVQKLTKDHKRDRTFDPQEFVPKKIRPKAMDYYARAEGPKGELGFFMRTNGKSDIPERLKARSCCFCNLSVLPELGKGNLLSDLIVIMGSIDIIMGEVDR
ncbi:NADH-quinone oxidoreductase subunit D [Flammeovirga pacifica]|uniref:NADH-quinone oxidoreductase subunit D n=1 Tax=Flammeovirga pacifica TaxID=915059 RepID=A0A1S1YW45_FLAPC|nr:NADH-quinone oxidoreductase subunit D [Flammeovirga pacifica]OHX65252.1 NADH dehydrogenase [Flammeovirga pacifica]